MNSFFLNYKVILNSFKSNKKNDTEYIYRNENFTDGGLINFGKSLHLASVNLISLYFY